MSENLEIILKGREERAEKQKKLLETYKNHTLVCMTLNIPGPVKRFPLESRTFDEAVVLLNRHFRGNGFEVLHSEKVERKSGQELYLIVNSNAEEVKKVTCGLEENHPFGRLLDIDVIAPNGVKISRKTPRKCLICNENAAVCARSRAHGINSVVENAKSIMQTYFDEKFASEIASNAVRALLYEVCTAPKPGLVDINNCGAHNDMDLFTFIDSTAVLTEYFRKITLFGINFAGEKADLLKNVRYLGIEADENMFRATNGVNTHQGAIYSIGILCCSCGKIYREKSEITAENIFKISAEIAQNEDDFGARNEVKNGFPSIKNIAFPIMQKLKESGFSKNGVACGVLLALISEVKDTNIISRGGENALENVQKTAQKTLKKLLKTLKNTEKTAENELKKELFEMDLSLISQNLSPGGCADLLAATLFIDFIIENTPII